LWECGKVGRFSRLFQVLCVSCGKTRCYSAGFSTVFHNTAFPRNNLKDKTKKIEPEKLADKPKYDNLSTIQVLIAIRYTLSQYYQKVKRRGEEILDVIDFSAFPFGQTCPICHAPSCARFIGSYERQVIDEKGRYFQDFPVPRFLCKGKGTFKSPHQHKTFSLLHYHIVPYWKYSIPFIIKVLNARYVEKMSLEALLDHISDFTSRGSYYVELPHCRIASFIQLIKTAIVKICANAYYPKLIEKFYTDSLGKQIKEFLLFSLDFQCDKFHYPIRGPCAVAVDYYLKGGSYFLNSDFLFGKPSQFR